MTLSPFIPFINGIVKCPVCRRVRPMTDLMGEYDAASDHFTVKGFHCTTVGCKFHHPDSLVGLIRWGSQAPVPPKIPRVLDKPECPYCGKVTIPVPDGNGPRAGTREVEYVRCPDSPLVYRLVVPAVKTG